MKKSISEVELVRACQRQDRKSQKLLFDRYYPDMMAVCLRYAKDEDEAQEILQKGFIKVFAKFSLYNNEGSLKGWILSIIVRTAIDHYRWQKRENRSLVPDDISSIEQIEEAQIEPELAAEEILRFIQQLPSTHRAVFNLFALEGHTHKEIAAELEITEGTSKWYLCEARKLLKKALAPVYPARIKEYAA